MIKHLISSVQYPQRAPREVHYLYVGEHSSGYEFIAGCVIGQGLAAGGGESRFDITGLLNRHDYHQFMEDIQCLWLEPILADPALSDEEKYQAIIQRAAFG